MDAKELRIGNYVQCINGVSEISEISENSVKLLDGYFWDIKNGIEPIILTEEWYFKFSFNKTNDNKFYITCFNFKITICPNKYIVIDEIELEHIKYVHQLQNLFFSITERELILHEKQKIYISGPISGLDYNEALHNFNMAEEYLKSTTYFDVINPMKISEKSYDKTWKDYMVEDIYALFDCTHIYMLKNWDISKGAKIELAISKELGLEIIYQQ